MNELTHQGFITIGNDGPLIRNTNYWDTQLCKSGYAFLSWNAGTARLLLPANLNMQLLDMATAREVIISHGPLTQAGGRECLEILFDDCSDEPYVLTIGCDQADRIPGDAGRGSFPLAIWTQQGLKQTHIAKFRRVRRLPCLKPWGSKRL